MRNRKLRHFMLFALLAIGTVLPVHGQNLHAIVFADTKDPSVGIFDLEDYYGISVEVSTIASATGMQLKKYFYKDEQCSNANLRNVLNQLKTNSDDVILFYYSGHGARSIDDNSDFPQMCLGSHYDEDWYPLEKVLKQLEQQPARLKIILGDCCNSVAAGATPKNYETKNATVLSKEPVNVYCNLFKNNTGFLITSSSTKGETSSTVSYTDGKPAGGAFTVCLLSTLKEYAASGMAATWDDVMKFTKQRTYNLRQHTPVYTINIKESQTTTEPAAYQEPQNTATDQDDDDDEIEMITILAAIGNEQLGIEKRVEIQDKALNFLFSSPNAKVEVVASNGSTIVATKRAEDYVLQLCTAHNLINLVEVDYKLDSEGRYSYLKVHEIYKK